MGVIGNYEEHFFRLAARLNILHMWILIRGYPSKYGLEASISPETSPRVDFNMIYTSPLPLRTEKRGYLCQLCLDTEDSYELAWVSCKARAL